MASGIVLERTAFHAKQIQRSGARCQDNGGVAARQTSRAGALDPPAGKHGIFRFTLHAAAVTALSGKHRGGQPTTMTIQIISKRLFSCIAVC
jgi:hypothetical protein